MIQVSFYRKLSWHTVLLEDKELTIELQRDRQLLLNQKHVSVIRVR